MIGGEFQRNLVSAHNLNRNQLKEQFCNCTTDGRTDQ